MKSFIASILVFCALLGVILINYSYVLRVCDEIEQKIDALPECEKADEAVFDLLALWDKQCRKLKVSISLHQIDKMEEALADLHCAVTIKDTRTFEQSRFRAKAILEDIRNGEVPRVENLM